MVSEDEPTTPTMSNDVVCFMSQQILPTVLPVEIPTTHRTSMIEDTCKNTVNCKCNTSTESLSRSGKKLNLDNKEQIVDAIQQLPIDSKQFLIYASCFGAKLDELILKQFTDMRSELVLSHCELLGSYGLLLKCNEDTIGQNNDDFVDYVWKFPNASVIEAAYDMIPATDRSEFHYNIGLKLWQQFTVNEIDKYIFVLVDQLLHGIELIKKNKTAGEGTAVAKLLLVAGERAVQSSDFDMATRYLSHSISLLDNRKWRQEYELSLKLYNAAAEVAYCSGDFDRAHALVELLLLHAQHFEDKIQAYAIKIFSFGTSGKLSAAIETGIFVLSKLGENLPLRPSKIRLLRELLRAKSKLRGMTDDAVLNLPLLQDSKIESVMKILDAMSSYAYVDSVMLGGLLRLRIMNLTLSHGQSAMSPTGFLGYGIFLSGRNIDEGFRFGRLAFQMFEKQNVVQWTGRVYLQYFGLIHSLKMPLKDTVVHLKYGYRTALQKGDIEYAFLCGTFFLYFGYEIFSLHDLQTETIEIREQMKMRNQEHSLAVTKLLDTFLMFVHSGVNSDGTRTDPMYIDDKAFQFDEIVMETIRPWTYFNLLMVDYLFGNINRAYRQVKVLLRYIEKAPSPVAKTFHAIVLFYVGLVSIEHKRRYNNRSGLKDAKKCLKMINVFAEHAPCNNRGKLYLLEAEYASVTKNDSVARSKYLNAIDVSKESGFPAEQALSYELSAKFWLSKGEFETAKEYYTNSILHYRKWGSEPKVTHLQKEIGFHFSTPN